MKRLFLFVLLIAFGRAGAQTLYVPSGTSGISNSSNSNVGIGTSSPSSKLEITGLGADNVDFRVNGRIMTGDAANGGGVWVTNTGTMFFGANGGGLLGLYNQGWRVGVLSNGNVGIGTLSPQGRLDVVGAGGSGLDLNVNGRITTGDANNVGGMWVNSNRTMFVGQFGANSIGFFNSGYWRVLVDNNGNVGIGTATTNGYRLAVDGTIGAREINVNTATWYDHVFAPDYKLPSLEEVERYVKQNRHLPDVPSAKDVEEKGVNVGEMNAVLVKKIEELTLYVIELKKEMDQMKKEKH